MLPPHCRTLLLLSVYLTIVVIALPLHSNESHLPFAHLKHANGSLLLINIADLLSVSLDLPHTRRIKRQGGVRCHDAASNCDLLKRFCTRNKYADAIKKLCPKSCGFCTPPKLTCHDSTPKCASLASFICGNTAAFTENQQRMLCMDTCFCKTLTALTCTNGDATEATDVEQLDVCFEQCSVDTTLIESGECQKWCTNNGDDCDAMCAVNSPTATNCATHCITTPQAGRSAACERWCTDNANQCPSAAPPCSLANTPANDAVCLFECSTSVMNFGAAGSPCRQWCTRKPIDCDRMCAAALPTATDCNRCALIADVPTPQPSTCTAYCTRQPAAPACPR